MKLNPYTAKALLLGAKLYGTGGGGDPEVAKRLTTSIRKQALPYISPLEKFDQNDLFITAFTVGGLSKSTITQPMLNKALAILQNRLQRNISGVMPVEIGPLSLALALKTASLLNLDLIDADFVGGRSSPEVFLETISLFDIPRTPLVVIDQIGNTAVLERAASPVSEEAFLRQFTLLSNKPALVMGYPVPKKLLNKTIESGTVTQALQAGKLLKSGLTEGKLKLLRAKVIFKGKVEAIEVTPSTGFDTRNIVIKNDARKICTVWAKNENLIALIDGKPILTCPDLITICTSRFAPLYNLEIVTGLEVAVLGLKARPLWRLKSGLDLFNPRLFDFDFPPKLLP